MVILVLSDLLVIPENLEHLDYQEKLVHQASMEHLGVLAKMELPDLWARPGLKANLVHQVIQVFLVRKGKLGLEVNQERLATLDPQVLLEHPNKLIPHPHIQHLLTNPRPTPEEEGEVGILEEVEATHHLPIPPQRQPYILHKVIDQNQDFRTLRLRQSVHLLTAQIQSYPFIGSNERVHFLSLQVATLSYFYLNQKSYFKDRRNSVLFSS